MPKRPLSFLDALFTSTSAMSVTGLIIVDTAYSFAVLGQWVILLLIQIGGLGVMTFSVLFSMGIKGHPGLSSQFLIQESFPNLKAASLQGLILTIVLFTLACEGTLALAMTAAFLLDAPGRPQDEQGRFPLCSEQKGRPRKTRRDNRQTSFLHIEKLLHGPEPEQPWIDRYTWNQSCSLLTK